MAKIFTSQVKTLTFSALDIYLEFQNLFLKKFYKICFGCDVFIS